jgi:hypothetical protein
MQFCHARLLVSFIITVTLTFDLGQIHMNQHTSAVYAEHDKVKNVANRSDVGTPTYSHSYLELGTEVKAMFTYVRQCIKK